MNPLEAAGASRLAFEAGRAAEVRCGRSLSSAKRTVRRQRARRRELGGDRVAGGDLQAQRDQSERLSCRRAVFQDEGMVHRSVAIVVLIASVVAPILILLQRKGYEALRIQFTTNAVALDS